MSSQLDDRGSAGAGEQACEEEDEEAIVPDVLLGEVEEHKARGARAVEESLRGRMSGFSHGIK